MIKVNHFEPRVLNSCSLSKEMHVSAPDSTKSLVLGRHEMTRVPVVIMAQSRLGFEVGPVLQTSLQVFCLQAERGQPEAVEAGRGTQNREGWGSQCTLVRCALAMMLES